MHMSISIFIHVYIHMSKESLWKDSQETQWQLELGGWETVKVEK